MRILIVKLSSLGDVIQTLPVIHDIQAQIPDVKIDWVVEEAFAGLLREVPGLERVVPCAQRRWRQTPFSLATRREWRAFWTCLRAEAYDLVIDFQGLIKSARIARGARLARGGTTVTYGNRSELCAYEWPVRWLLKKTVPMEARLHAVARYRTLAARALGADSAGVLAHAPQYPFNFLRPVPPQGIVFAHGTTRTDNEWPLESWLELGRLCIADGQSVLLPHANVRELEFVQALAQQLGPRAHVWPRLALAEILPRMAEALGVISVDSGLGHLAVALDVPVVQIFSQPRVWRAGPVGRAHQIAVGGECAPEVADVWRAWVHCVGADPRVSEPG